MPLGSAQTLPKSSKNLTELRVGGIMPLGQAFHAVLDAAILTIYTLSLLVAILAACWVARHLGVLLAGDSQKNGRVRPGESRTRRGSLLLHGLIASVL